MMIGREIKMHLIRALASGIFLVGLAFIVPVSAGAQKVKQHRAYKQPPKNINKILKSSVKPQRTPSKPAIIQLQEASQESVSEVNVAESITPSVDNTDKIKKISEENGVLKFQLKEAEEELSGFKRETGEKISDFRNRKRNLERQIATIQSEILKNELQLKELEQR